MAHELEILNGTAGSFVSAREHAWHRLGTVLDDVFTAEQAMRYAHLGGWNVRKVALQTVPQIDANGVTAPMEVADRFATVRTNPVSGTPDVLGVVGPDYHVIQNEEHAELLNAVVDESGAHFETAGSLRGGTQVFLSMKLPRGILIGGVDPVDLYLIATNSHDGSSAFRLLVSPVRVVCANTQAAAFRSMRSSFSIRHTSGAKGRIEQARQALGMTWEYVGAFQDAAERMISADIDRAEFARIIAQTWPETTGTTKRADNTAARRAQDIQNLRTASPTLPDEFRGTRWGAYQAITEYIDHVAPTRGGKGRPGVQADIRAERAAIGTGPALKLRAFELLTV
jgi:phage/plasmid-like protein (TIGR03299 family)